jgi:ABC-type nitrate/sulfonate/bicarbonate transport system permease component
MCLPLKRKLQSTTSKLSSVLALAVIVIVWEMVCDFGIVPAFMLPSPVSVVKALVGDTTLLCQNGVITLQEAFYGLFCGVAIGFLAAILMDSVEWIYRAFYPIMVITQTIPTVAIAPLLVLWFGYEMLPKIILIVLMTFFPIAVGLLDGFRSVDRDAINLMRSMGASRVQIFRYVKLPFAMPQFFSGLRLAVTYSVVGAVISEWLGGFGGLGVYMTRVKKAFAFDKMFAVIFIISAISLILMWLVDVIQKKCMPYQNANSKESKS